MLLVFGISEQEILDHVYPSDRLFLAYIDGSIVGFATATLRDQYLDFTGAAVKEDFQGLGIHSSFTQRRLNFALDNDFFCFELRTQNPKIELSVRQNLESLVKIGIIDEFSISRELVKSLYGRMLTAIKPFSGVEEIDVLYENLDYESGDAYRMKFKIEVRK